MNGTWKNWLIHAGLSLAISLVFGPAAAIFGFWMKEAGEKSKQLENRSLNPVKATFSDFNPLGRRWNFDDQMDLLSALVPAIVIILV